MPVCCSVTRTDNVLEALLFIYLPTVYVQIKNIARLLSCPYVAFFTYAKVDIFS
jgi:hypothetical protein